MAAKHQDETCVACHGPDLKGGASGVSCDTCHSGATHESWRTNCTFCHGGIDNPTGAPPEGISDQTNGAGQAFTVHSTHVEVTSLTSAFDCVQCHVKPADVLAFGYGQRSCRYFWVPCHGWCAVRFLPARLAA